MLLRGTTPRERPAHRTEGDVENTDTQAQTDSPLERFEAAAVAALRAGYTIDDLTPWLLSAIDTVAELPAESPNS
jgi:hypothetical protein